LQCTLFKASGETHMSEEELFSRLRKCLREGDTDAGKAVCQEMIKANTDPLKAINTCSDEMRKIGDDFEKGKLYLPHLMMAAGVMKEIVTTLTPLLPSGKKKSIGTIVIGTVAGDVHDLGKDIVAVMLEAAGFDVINIGRDVPASKFAEKAKEVDAAVVGASALMTTTMLELKTLAEELQKTGLRNKLKFIVGGAPISEEWAKAIGADARGEDAIDAVSKVRMLLGVKE